MAEPVPHEVCDILVTGGAGQVGLELARAGWPDSVRLHMPPRDELDLADAEAVRALFAATAFKAVINSGAYTAVDKAETEVTAAFAANAMGPAILAELTGKAGIPLVQVSTDYVFDGSSQADYVESDPVGPLGVYGASKLAGEVAVRTGNRRSVVLRTAWVLSPHRANFLKTMLRLAADRPALRVVDDQTGSPTSAKDIAETLAAITLRMIADPAAPTGLYHFVNAGSTSWAGLARAIFAESVLHGGPSAQVEGIATADYPTPARRPANSRLSTFKISRDYGISPRPWRDAVAGIVAELHQETIA
ncbi:dTDP-4-dehydrorhamnose reductase [Brevundimonas sp. TWP2-3-4b1]|uniref:dTDP-4-dehydrorhamnose reductase n=1 Tax=Brevundimonas sp. TWP2-3-4b1 TaxID=2804580 RepID=UPI003CEB0999